MRLYRIGLTTHFDEILQDFELFDQHGGEWRPFAQSVDYQAFMVRRRSRSDEGN